MDHLRRARLEQLLAALDAFIDAMRFSALGDDVWRFSSCREHMRTYNDFYEAASKLIATDLRTYRYDLDAVPSRGDMEPVDQKAQFDSALANTQILRALVQQQLGPTQERALDIVNFISANLRGGMHDQPSNEREVQDVLETLLVGRGLQKGLDYDRETGRVKVSVKESVPDFVLPKLSLTIEVKLVTSPSRLRSIVDEINADIRAYGTKYSNLLFVIYDLGQIRDEGQFKRGLEDPVGVKLIVVKH